MRFTVFAVLACVASAITLREIAHDKENQLVETDTLLQPHMEGEGQGNSESIIECPFCGGKGDAAKKDDSKDN